MSFTRGTIIKAFIWKLLERCSTQVISFVVTIILARILSPKEYGVIAIITIFINLANVIVDGGLNTALIQKKDATKTDFSTIFCFTILMSVFLYFVLFFSAPAIAKFYTQPELVPVLRVLSINLLFGAVNSIQKAYVSKHMLFKKVFTASFGAIIVSGLVGIWMAYRGFGVWALVAQSMTSQIAITALTFVAVPWRPAFVFSIDSFKQLFNFGWKIFCTNFIIAIYNDIRGIVIGKLYQPQSLALFDRGKQFPSLIMTNINVSIQTIVFPVFAEEQDNRSRVKTMMRRSTQISCLVIFPLLMGMLVTAHPLISVILTDKWIEAVPFLQIFCVAYMLMPMQIANMEAIKSLGYSDITLKLEIIKKVLEAVILVASFYIGIYAVAWGVVIYNSICIFINLYPSKKLLDYGVYEQIRDIFPTLAVSIIMGLCVYPIIFLPLSQSLILLLQVFVGVFVYILFCKIFKLESYQYLKSMVKEKFLKR